MTYRSPHYSNISNDLIEEGMRRARVERSAAFYQLVDHLTGRVRSARKLSDG